MVKYVCVCLLMLAFAVPAFSQDYAQFEISLGYGNIGLNGDSPLITGGRHSGFTTHQTFNLNSVLGIENYIGYYGFGTPPALGIGKEQMFTDIFGARFNYRKAGPVLYGVAGFGGGFLRFPQYGGGSGNSMGFRLGGGTDIPIHDSLAIKVDVSRMGFHFDGWRSGINISTGLVLKISQ
jgi:Outer membrane protein beta-barrel domain